MLIGLAIGAFFVWLSAKDWPLDKLVGPLSLEAGHLVVGNAVPPASDADISALLASSGWTLDLIWLLPYLGILVLIHFLRVIRWMPLLNPIVKLPFAVHNRIGSVGFMAMFLFPLRLGELVRPYMVKREANGPDRVPGEGIRMTQVLATVVVERVIDGLMVALLLFLILGALPTTVPETQAKLAVGAYAALAVFAGATFLLALAAWKHDLARALTHRTLGLLSSRAAKGVDSLVGAFLGGLRQLPSRRAFLGFLVLTAIYWAINGIGVWCMLRAFHLPIDLVGAYAMMATVVVGMMIPNSPGNVGSFWYFLLLPAPLYGVTGDVSQAIAFGLTVWLLQLVQQSAFGFYYIVRGKVSWRRVVEATYEDEDSITADVTTPPSNG